MELSKNHGRELLLFQFTSLATKLSQVIIVQFPDLCVLERIIRKHGFRPGCSCLSALLDVFDNIMHMLDSNSSVDMAYLDFSKAFDQVDHGNPFA